MGKRTRTKTEECTERNGEENARYHMARENEQHELREQTKVADKLMTIKKKKWSWAGHIMHRTDNIWTRKVTEWEPRNSKRSQNRQKIRWRDEIVAFTGVGWSTLTSDRER